MPKYDLFISYRRLDAQRVRPLLDSLRGLGIAVWIDESEIEDFSAVTLAIKEGLAQSKAVLAWYSAIYPLSRPCQWELTAAYLAAQQSGNPRQRVLIVNPETTPDHIALPELKDQQYLSAPAMDDHVDYDDLATRIAAQVQGLTGTLGDIRPLVTPSWYPYTATGSARFVGRLRHMWQSHDMLWRGQTVIGQLKQGTALAQLVGGGMGKSLLAEEYALRYGAAYPGGVFWVSARTAEDSGAAASGDALAQQREQHWRNVAAWLGMEIKDLTLVQIEGALHAHFARQSQPFLWVIDDVPRDVPMQQLRGWVAPHPLGKTLLTTRSHEYESLGGMVNVDVLAEAEARSLLTQQRSPADATEVAAVAGILTALGNHALAVDVAAARLKGKPYPEFLADLNHPDADALELASRFAGQLPNGHEGSIAITLLQSIDNVNEETRDFLRLAAVLAVAPIPRRLVAQIFVSTERSSSLWKRLGQRGIGTDKATLAKDLADLALHEAQEQSLAEATGDTDFSVTVHVLVSRTVHFRDIHLKRSAALRISAVQAHTVELTWQADDIRNHAALANWISHARHLVAGADDDLAVVELCERIARYDFVRGTYAAARALQEKALAAHRRVMGREHTNTLTSMNNLALTLQTQGDLVGARTIQEKALEISLRVLGEEHPNTLASINNLSLTLQAQGDLVEARIIQEQGLELSRRVLGEEHPTTLMITSNLAETLLNQSDIAGARMLHENALAARRRVLGEEHQDTLTSMVNLAMTLQAQGDLVGARTIQEKALEISLRVLGEEHPNTLKQMSNLASTLALIGSQGDLTSAHALLEKVLAISRRVLGEEDQLTLTCMHNIANVLNRQGNLADARVFQEKVLIFFRRVRGEEHPLTLTCMCNLAHILQAQGDLLGARTILEKGLEVSRRVRGAQHSDTTLAAWNLLMILQQEGLHDQVILLAQEHLVWLMDAASETLSAVQRQIRDHLKNMQGVLTRSLRDV